MFSNRSARQIRVALATLPLLAGSLLAQTEQITGTKYPFLWRVEGKIGEESAAKSWLYGTMHIGDQRLVTLPEVVDSAVESSDAVFCELDMKQAQRDQLSAIRTMALPRGQTLEDQLPVETYERLGKYLAKHGMSVDNLANLRVWAVNMTLASLEASFEGMTQSLDLSIYELADELDKETGGLETMDEQIQVLAGSSKEDQIAMLAATLDDLEESEARGSSSIEELLKIYLTGDEAALLEKASESMRDDKALNDRLLKRVLYDRNVTMANRMVEKMQAEPEKAFFFAVGAMHYPGEKGIVDLLRRKGYRITRIAAPPKVDKRDEPIRQQVLVP